MTIQSPPLTITDVLSDIISLLHAAPGIPPLRFGVPGYDQICVLRTPMRDEVRHAWDACAVADACGRVCQAELGWALINDTPTFRLGSLLSHIQIICKFAKILHNSATDLWQTLINFAPDKQTYSFFSSIHCFIMRLSNRMKYFFMAPILVISMASCHSHNESEHGDEHADEHAHNHGADEIVLEPHDAQRLGVEVDTVRPGAFTETLKVSGEVLPSSTDRGVVSAPTSGVIRLNLGINAGTQVRAGQAIALNHSPQHQRRRCRQCRQGGRRQCQART